MSSYLKLLVVIVCAIEAYNCDFFGDAAIQAADSSTFYVVNDRSSYIILTNEEFTSDSYLTSIEFYATGAGKIGLGFLGFTGCGRANQPSCQSFMSKSMVGNNAYVQWIELPLNYIVVDDIGYVYYDLPEPILVPRGFTPYLIQITTGVSFVPSQMPDLFWAQQSMSTNLGALIASNGSPLKALVKLNVQPAPLSSESVSYGVDVPASADQNTILTPAQGYQFYLLNAPITYDAYITAVNVYASAAGNVTISSTIFDGCQLDSEQSCVDLLLNYKLNSPYWTGAFPLGIPDRVTLNLKKGFNNFKLSQPIFAPRKSILTLNPSPGQVATEKGQYSVPDLSNTRANNGQYARVGTNPNQAFLVNVVANNFAVGYNSY